jgi:outer membrane receptor protein involved in Fe transport
MNPGDLDDERIGASLRRRDIAAFFASGIIQPWISPGSDGIRATPDDVFNLTGETLREILDRVLPVGSVVRGTPVVNDDTRVPLLTVTPGWSILDVRGGLSISRYLSAGFGVTNLFDRNYRIHGSGVDAAGISVFAGVRWVF